MPKKTAQKRENRDHDQVLKAVLAELEELSRNQKKSIRDLNKLKKRLKGLKQCGCCKPKKKKKPKKSGKKASRSTIETVEQRSFVEGKSIDSTPVGLLNIVSAPENGTPDDLKWIAGVGPKLEETLNELGIFYYEQIAKWTPSEIEWVDDYLQFPGRIERDNWIEQAKALARGGWDEYVNVFGKEPR